MFRGDVAYLDKLFKLKRLGYDVIETSFEILDDNDSNVDRIEYIKKEENPN